MPINYDPQSHSFTNLDPAWLTRCREAYPNIKIEQALKQASLWLDADWPKRAKKKYERFLLNWFSRAERDSLLKAQNTKAQPGFRPVMKRPPIEELVPQSEVRDFIKQLANMKEMK